MTKLRKIAIKNFQCIEDAVLALGDITVLLGKSRSGKSAFYRAIKGAVENRSGDEFITFGKKETRVRLDDVIWVQSKTKNKYVIVDPDDADSEIEVFDKCGRNVPEVIRQKFNMGRIEFGEGLKVNLNFCDQLGQIFLVEGRGSDNAKVVGGITNLHQIYNGLRDAQRDYKRIKKQVQDNAEQLERAIEKRDEVSEQFEKVDKKFKVVKKIYETAVQFSEWANKLQGIRKRARVNSERLKTVTKRFKLFRAIDLEQANDDAYYLARLQGVRERAQATTGRLKKLIPYVNRFNEIDINEVKRFTDYFTRLQRIKAKISNTLGKITATERRIAVLEGVLTKKPAGILKKIETLLQAKYKADTQSERIAEIRVKIEVMDDRLAGLNAEMDGFDVCDVCGAEKEHWNL